MATLERHEFAKHLNSTFRLPEKQPRLDLQLIEVSDLKQLQGHESFWLLFQGPKDNFLPQGTHQFHHDVMGEFEMFIVPIREDGTGFHYQAIFNRIR